MEVLPTSSTLSFCKGCESLRVRDVKEQLQKLFAERSFSPNLCGICKRPVEVKNDLKKAGCNKLPELNKNEERAEYNKEADFVGDDHKGSSSNDENTTSKISHGENQVKIETPKSDKPQLVEDLEVPVEATKSGSTYSSRVYDDKVDDVNDEADDDDDYLAVPTDESCLNENGRNDLTSYPSKSIIKTDENSISTMNIDMEVKESKKTQSLEPKRRTRLSTGAIQAKRYQSSWSVNECNSDDEDYNISDDDVNADDTDGSDADCHIELPEPIVHMENDDKDDASDNASSQISADKWVKYGTKGLVPELLELMVTSDDPKKPFKCKFCNDYFRYLSVFQNHVKDHTGKERVGKPYMCIECGKKFPKISVLLTHKSTHIKKTYKCTYRRCKYTFSNRAALRSHFLVHKGVKHFKCKICGLGFKLKSSLDIHQTVHSEERPFSCGHCDKTFSHKTLKRQHEIMHENLDRFKCDKCSYSCRTKYSLRMHKETHENRGAFECDKCKYVFTYQVLLDKHVKLNKCKPPTKSKRGKLVQDTDSASDAHIDISEITQWLDVRVIDLMGKAKNIEAPYSCMHCSKEFQTAYPFLKHMKITHPKQCPAEIESLIRQPYKCNQCDMKIKNFSMLKYHLISHSSQRIYECDHIGCDKNFKTRHGLKAHQMIHKERQHMCSFCGARFITQSKLTEHVNCVHLNLKPFNCSYCNKAFGYKVKKELHEKRVHLNLRPWVCEICGKSFKEKMELTVHSRKHTGEKPYSCEYCEYRCVRLDYLNKHRRIHTGEKPYQCAQCNKPFALRTTLVLHMKKQHHAQPELMTTLTGPLPPSSSDENLEEKVAIDFLQQDCNF